MSSKRFGLTADTICAVKTACLTANFFCTLSRVITATFKLNGPWPAQVIGIFRNKARVKFFGDLREI